MRGRKNEKTTGADEAGAVVLTGLAPVAGEAPRILMLGSMPGAASLAAAQYYAHPANRFWPLMALLFPEEAARLSSSDYEERLEGLRRSGVALWDTIGSCERAGSLDSSIRNMTPNDVAGLLKAHPTIGTVVLNGSKSAAVWRRHAQREALGERPGLRVLALPSTSPANARLRLADLERVWRAALAVR